MASVNVRKKTKNRRRRRGTQEPESVKERFYRNKRAGGLLMHSPATWRKQRDEDS